jgi:hypothetical protein
MSSAGIRERALPLIGPGEFTYPKKLYGYVTYKDVTLQTGKQKTVSESHRKDPKTGSYYEGGPFYTSRVSWFLKPGHVKDAYNWSRDAFYTGPVYGDFPSLAEMNDVSFKNTGLKFGDENSSKLKTDGTNAISYSSPINPASELGTTMAESIREGLPTIPGIQTWRQRTEILKGLGSEYLNYIFGWHPLAEEVSAVRDAARFHRTIMKNYHAGEGQNTHRTFRYPSQRSSSSKTYNTYPTFPGEGWYWLSGEPIPKRVVSRVTETKRWFEGCYTYALPSSADNWRKAIGFGSQADQLFGFSLTPDVLWELTPWSWAVDWFTNAGEVINNIGNFASAGLVLRYGYMMEESIENITVEGSPAVLASTDPKSPRSKELKAPSSSWSCGIECVTKRRLPASPFGFSVGWEGLSPTQLAITAALGITRLL